MHWIQYDILLQLSRTDEARYSELRPKDVEGNLFMYHLKRLVSQGWVRKTDHAYALTALGKEEIGSLRLSVRKFAKPPQAIVAVVYRHADELILFRWNREPYRGLVSLPFGRMHAGTSLMEMARQQLYYKTGLEAQGLTVAGTVEVRLKAGEELLRHHIIQVCTATGPRAAVAADGLTGQPFWGNPEEVEAKDWVPGFAEIARQVIEAKSLFFSSLDIAQ